MDTESIVEPTCPLTVNALPNEILWEIFIWNANIFVDKDCLEIALRSSQVCRAWRSFSLASPALWGRLLDFRFSSLENDRWRKEVLRKSGESLLWVHAILTGLTPEVQAKEAFIYSLLESHGERIQHLLLVDFLFISSLRKDISRFLLRPAPNLRSCTLPSYPQHSYPLDTTPPVLLFNDTAPSLQYVHIDIFFRLTAPWLSQLRRLEISKPFTPVEILNALQTTRLLEFLGAYNMAPNQSIDSRLLSVDLPKLKEIRLRLKSILPVVDLLEQIQPAESCALKLFINLNQISTSTQEYEGPTYTKRLSYLAQRYLRSLDVTRIEFCVSQRILTFQVPTSSGDTVFELGFSSDVLFIQKGFPSLLYHCDFSFVSKFYFDLCSSSQISASDYFSFFQLFTSVTDLHIGHARTLRMFLDIPTSSSLIFPLLNTLQIDFFEQPLESSTGSVITDAILPFLQQRCNSGLPLRTLVFCMSPEQATQDLDALAEMQGLHIHWRGADKSLIKWSTMYSFR